MLRDNLLRRLLQVARPAVVAKPGPQAQHFLLRRGGKGVNVRKALEKPLVVRNHRGDSRLLQHNFREPHAIRIARAPPRQVTLELPKPREQLFAKGGEFLSLKHGASGFSHKCPLIRVFIFRWLLHFFVEEHDERRTPYRMREKAARLAGHDDLEELRRRCEFTNKSLLGIERERLHHSQVSKDFENMFLAGSQGSIEVDAAKRQHGVGLIKVPADLGAKVHGTLEAL